MRACYLLCLSQYCSTFRTTGFLFYLLFFNLSSPLTFNFNFFIYFFFFFQGVRSVQRTLKELPTEAEYVQLQTAALADRLQVLDLFFFIFFLISFLFYQRIYYFSQDCTVELLRQYVAAQARRSLKPFSSPSPFFLLLLR